MFGFYMSLELLPTVLYWRYKDLHRDGVTLEECEAIMVKGLSGQIESYIFYLKT